MEKDIKSQALANTEPVELPSKGWFYGEGNDAKSGVIDISYMTTYHEDILSSRSLLNKGVEVVLDRLLQSLIATPNINHKDLLLGDRDALLVAARILGYGSKYDVTVECPTCGQKSEQNIDLSIVEDKTVEFLPENKGRNEFLFTLPFSKKEIKFKLLTQKDEENIDAEIKAVSKFSNGVSPSISTRLRYQIIAIDGDIDKNNIRRFVEKEMNARDSRAFREHSAEISPSLNLKYTFECGNSSCGFRQEEVDVPIGTEFFWPKSIK